MPFQAPSGRHMRAVAEPSCRPDWGSERGGQGSLGDILGLTPPGYELSPLRGWGKHR